MAETDHNGRDSDVEFLRSMLNGVANPRDAVLRSAYDETPEPGAERWARTVREMSPEFLAARTRHLDGTVTTSRDGNPTDAERRTEALLMVRGARAAYDRLVREDSQRTATGSRVNTPKNPGNSLG
jgi:hypothetical protein